MPPETKSLPENVGKTGLPPGALLGLNDFKKTGYGESGHHRAAIRCLLLNQNGHDGRPDRPAPLLP
jgi:hypothetical protein